MRPEIVAHRGGARLWPENSHTAVRGALALGTDGVEVDVHLTRDGHVVVHHDARLGRTVLGQGRIRDLEKDALQGLPLLAHEEERIPLLDEVCALFATGEALLSVEIKNTSTGSPYPRVAETVLAALAPLGERGRVLVHAFDWRILERLRRATPTVAVAANISRRTVRRHDNDFLRALRAVHRRGFDHVNVDRRLLDDHSHDFCRKLGFTISVWTVNTEEELARIMDLGVDYITTDVPDLAMSVRAERFDSRSSRSASG